MIDERFARTELIFGEDGMRRLQRCARRGIRRRRRRRAPGAGAGARGRGAYHRHRRRRGQRVKHQPSGRRDGFHRRPAEGRGDCRAGAGHQPRPARLTPLRMFYTPESAETLDLAQFDAIADCIDTVKAKVDAGLPGEGGGRIRHQRDGGGQQARPDAVSGGGYRQNQRLPALPRDAHPAQKARRGAPHGRLFHRRTAEDCRRRAATAAMRPEASALCRRLSG